MKKIYLYILFLVLFPKILFSQIDIISEPRSIEINEIELPGVEKIIQQNMDKNIIPGGVFLIAHKGEIIFFKSFGENDKLNNKPYQKDDIFRIASMTKAVTATAIMQLYEQGKLDLEDPVYKYIPAFEKTKVLDKFNKEDSTYTTKNTIIPLTIQHLLTHTSGIYYGQFNKGKLKAIYQKNGLNRLGLSSKNLTTEEMVNKIAEVPLAFQPGTQWKYGLGYDVLGRVIEVVSKQDLVEYFQENIFEPLEMNDTYFYLPKNKQDRLVKFHTPKNKKRTILKSDPMDYPKLEDHKHYAGGGGLSSTTLDYAKFCLAFLNHGELNGNRILSNNSIFLMSNNQIPDSIKESGKGFTKIKGLGFGLGFGIITQERPKLWSFSEGTYFWGGAFNTKYFIDPDKELLILGMTQIYPFKHKKFWNQLNKEIYKSIDELKIKKNTKY